MDNDKKLFDQKIKEGHCQANPVYREFHHAFGKWITDAYRAMDRQLSLLDVGCGTGALVEYLLYRGVNAWGVTSNEYEQQYFQKRNLMHEDRVILLDAKNLGEIEDDYDVITCIEYFQCLDDESIDAVTLAMYYMCDHLLFSDKGRTEKEWITHFEWHEFKLASKPEIPTLWTLEFEIGKEERKFNDV